MAVVITALSPGRGREGDTLTITGTGFAASGNAVTVDGQAASIATEGTTEIVVTVPGSLTTDQFVYVRVTNVVYDEVLWWSKDEQEDIGNSDIIGQRPGPEEIARGLENENPVYQEAKDYERVATLAEYNRRINDIDSAGIISGGEITSNGDGSVAVASGLALLSIADAAMGRHRLFAFDADASVSLTDDVLNYVYLDYDSGTPSIDAVIDPTSLDHRTQFVIGVVFREGTEVHGNHAGQRIENFTHKVFMHQYRSHPVQITDGGVVSEVPDRYLDITEADAYFALNYLELDAFDSSASADAFTYAYRDGVGGWTFVEDQEQIDNTQYDDGSGLLATLVANRYGVHWVYLLLDEFDSSTHVYVLYGQGNYTLAEAEAAAPPSIVPDEISALGVLAAKITIQKSAANFYLVENPRENDFVFAPVSDHGGLAGLGDDDHTQYFLADCSRVFSGDPTPDGADTRTLGSATAEYADIYIGEAGKAYFGLDQDAQVWHSGAAFYLDNRTGITYFADNGTNRWAITTSGFFVPGASESSDPHLTRFIRSTSATRPTRSSSVWTRTSRWACRVAYSRSVAGQRSQGMSASASPLRYPHSTSIRTDRKSASILG